MTSFKYFLSLFIHIFLLTFIFVFVSSGAQDVSNKLLHSLYSFGDSFVDPGNNNYIETKAKSNFPPYGRDFVNQSATGRFSNGRLFADFLAYHLGNIMYQTPYLGPRLVGKEQVSAISFASATSGYDPQTANFSNAISMSKQLELFKQYKVQLQKKIGKKKANSQIKKAVFYVSAGSDDFAFSFFGDGSPTQKPINRNTYERFLLQLMQQFIQGLSDQGARKIAVNGLPPLGCIPVAITLLPPRNSERKLTERSCLEYVNEVVKEFNVKLQDELKTMQTTLSKVGTKIIYIDFEQPLFAAIQKPSTYGFTEVNKGCCGTGLYEIGIYCNRTTPVCVDTSQYVFWDAAHPSEKMYEIIFKSNQLIIDQLN